MYEDWGLIEASFTSQYGIRLRTDADMPWSEFCTLLAGIMPETPLGQIVSVRAENDKDTLKNFTNDQHEIRNKWRNRKVKAMDNFDAEEQVKVFQELMAKAFGK